MQRINSYYSNPRVNASLLKGLHNPKWIKWKLDNPEAEDSDKRHFRIGGALDTIFTAPEMFHQLYWVAPMDRPSGLMGIFIDNLPLTLQEDSEDTLYEEAYEKAKYKTPLKTVIKNLWQVEPYKSYYLARKQSLGKIILSADEYEEVISCKKELLTNEFTRRYFINVEKDVQVLLQVPIYFSYKDIECKALLDGVLINHSDQTIQPFDLKTIGKPVYSFPTSYLQYSYYLQSAFYTIALRSLFSGNGESEHPMLDKTTVSIMNNYKILPFQFLVVEKSGSNPARIFQCTDKDIEAGISGGMSKRGVRYEGVDELIDNYKWHLETGKWDHTRELYSTNGVQELNIFSP